MALLLSPSCLEADGVFISVAQLDSTCDLMGCYVTQNLDRKEMRKAEGTIGEVVVVTHWRGVGWGHD